MTNTHHKDKRAGDTHFQGTVGHTFSNELMLSCVAGTDKRAGIGGAGKAALFLPSKGSPFHAWGESPERG